jgi:hypothetical protein
MSGIPSPPNRRLLALGRQDLPADFEIGGRRYKKLQCFKHDFFAATGLYQPSTGPKVILKIGRQASLLGLPMQWIGRVLAHHEARLYTLAQGLDGIPAFLGRWGPTGIVHEYVEGRPLLKEDEIEETFFPGLKQLLDQLHAREIAYVDLEKRENILLGDDGKPHLIDFQISWHWPRSRGGHLWPFRKFLSMLQASDRYHLIKHWRRLRPDQLDWEKIAASYRAPFWIRWHRFVFRPWTLLRRQVLVWMGERDSARARSPG